MARRGEPVPVWMPDAVRTTVARLRRGDVILVTEDGRLPVKRSDPVSVRSTAQEATVVGSREVPGYVQILTNLGEPMLFMRRNLSVLVVEGFAHRSRIGR